jgi:monoterpene epsilon-lactone hydrolase
MGAGVAPRLSRRCRIAMQCGRSFMQPMPGVPGSPDSDASISHTRCAFVRDAMPRFSPGLLGRPKVAARMTTSWQNRVLSPVLRWLVRPVLFPRVVTPRRLENGYRWSRVIERLSLSPHGAVIEAAQLTNCAAEWLSVDGHNERVVLHFHGGGYSLFSPRSYRDFNARLARAAYARVFSVDYRQGPAHGLSAAVDDGLDAYSHLLARGYRAERIVIVGDSAGGHLTLSTLIALRARGLPQPAGAIAISPWTNLAADFPSVEQNRHTDVLLDADSVRAMGIFHARGRPLKDPALSPAFADYTGIAPLQIMASGSEVLRDDARAVREAATAAGVFVHYEEYPGLPHAFPGLANVLPEARASIRSMARFILSRTGAA